MAVIIERVKSDGDCFLEECFNILIACGTEKWQCSGT